jgi:23S rRNA pseudouridine1911/1915/1917 synthase
MGFLMASFPGKSRTSIKSLLANKMVYVDGKAISQFNYILKQGQFVEINKSIPKPTLNHPKLQLIFEDEYFVVVSKKEGLLSVATDEGKETTAYSILSQYVKLTNPKSKIFILHRLDRDTSGLLVFAKSIDIQEYMQKNWHEMVTERKYVALVEGNPGKPKGTIVSWLKENKGLVVYSSPKDNGGQKAISHYQVLKGGNNFSLVEIELETGRKNQIRVHMQDLGHPVAGDKKYGSTQNPLGRLCLHAHVLSFIHPVTEQEIQFKNEIPKEFLRV